MESKLSLLKEASKKPSEKKRAELKDRQVAFLRNCSETLASFGQNMKVLSSTSTNLLQITTEIQQSQTNSNTASSLKKLSFLVEQIQTNNDQSNKCLNLLL